MSSHMRGPLLVSSARRGLLENLRIEAVGGEGDLITVFDDFDQTIITDTFGGTGFEANGWIASAIGTVAADSITQNSTTTGAQNSCIRLNAGTAADTGGNLQLSSSATVFDYPHIKIPTSGVAATILDNTRYVFACRIGLMSNAATWDGKAFIGWAEEVDPQILTSATGVITQAETGPLVGFHIPQDGSIDAISQRTVNTAYAAGTNFTELYAAGSANGTANIPEWYDLAVVLDITDMSDNAANGRTTFYHRRVRSRALDPTLPEWIRHPTVLSNQTPNNNFNLTPTIELQNGPTNQSDLFVDWWAFGATRYSRTGR